MAWNIENTWGLYLGKTPAIDYAKLVELGGSFIVGEIANSGWSDVVQQAYDAKVPAVLGWYTLDPVQMYEANPTHAYWSDPGNVLKDTNMVNNPAWKVISNACKNKYMQGLILNVENATSPGGSVLTPSWIRITYVAMLRYIREKLSSVNPRIKIVLPATTKKFIDDFANELGDYLYGKEAYSLAINRTVAIPDWTARPMPTGKPDAAYAQAPWGWLYGLNSTGQVGVVMYRASKETLCSELGVIPQEPGGDTPPGGNDTPPDEDETPPVGGGTGGLAKSEYKALLKLLGQKLIEAADEW